LTDRLIRNDRDIKVVLFEGIFLYFFINIHTAQSIIEIIHKKNTLPEYPFTQMIKKTSKLRKIELIAIVLRIKITPPEFDYPGNAPGKSMFLI